MSPSVSSTTYSSCIPTRRCDLDVSFEWFGIYGLESASSGASFGRDAYNVIGRFVATPP
jgi:hypothetical protein